MKSSNDIFNYFTVFILLGLFSTSCYKEKIILPDDPIGGKEYLEDWTDETHGIAGDANYDLIFPQNKVNRLDIVISEENWQAMMQNMTSLFGEFGVGGIHPGMKSTTEEDPIWVPCSMFFEGKEWYRVGVRFKGNSSLRSSWQSGIMKLPFKIKMDEYEDIYPEILDQRFHGFKRLSLSSGFEDNSLMREKVTADIFSNMGLASSRTAFYRVYVNSGDGPVYFGLYTMVEVVEGTVLDDHFSDDTGNCYKPENTGATFKLGSFKEADFEKKTNELTSDWSDIIGLFDALHASNRQIDPAAWRSGLESVFDVDVFLKWLATNTVIQNWDTYGNMSHNYYLYNNPENNLLTWIPWDNNESLKEGKMAGAKAIDLSDVTNDWPLIRFLIDDATYRQKYRAYVADVINGAFQPAVIKQTYQNLHDLIQPYVTGSEGEIDGYTFLKSDADFTNALTELLNHVDSRYTVATNYLNTK